MAVDIKSILGNLNGRWNGTRYQLISTNLDLNSQAIVLADIAEIDFPSVEIEYRTIPTLGIRELKIPSRKVIGDLVLRGSVIRSPVLFEAIQRMIDVLDGRTSYNGTANNFIIAEYGSSSLLGTLPIRSWFVKNAQPKSFKAPSANANSDTMPLEELVFCVDDFRAL